MQESSLSQKSVTTSGTFVDVKHALSFMVENVDAGQDNKRLFIGFGGKAVIEVKNSRSFVNHQSHLFNLKLVFEFTDASGQLLKSGNALVIINKPNYSESIEQ